MQIITHCERLVASEVYCKQCITQERTSMTPLEIFPHYLLNLFSQWFVGGRAYRS